MIDKIIAYENGDLDDDETLDLFSYLVGTGLAWQLQGHYGRMAKALIDNEYLSRDGKILQTIGEEDERE